MHDPTAAPRPADLLLSPLLLASLALLVLNDWVLKAAFHNAVTGKLSDVAGVAALALCLRALLPARRTVACVLAGAAFALWKSPAVEPLIDGWNGLGWMAIGRVVDWTDLAALLVLPFIHRYRPPTVPAMLPRRAGAVAVGAACMLAFAATSIAQKSTAVPGTPEHSVHRPPEGVRTRLNQLGILFWSAGADGSGSDVDTLSINPGRETGMRLVVELRPAGEGSVLRLVQVETPPRSRVTADSARSVFERVVVEALRRDGLRGRSDPPVIPLRRPGGPPDTVIRGPSSIRPAAP